MFIHSKRQRTDRLPIEKSSRRSKNAAEIFHSSHVGNKDSLNGNMSQKLSGRTDIGISKKKIKIRLRPRKSKSARMGFASASEVPLYETVGTQEDVKALLQRLRKDRTKTLLPPNQDPRQEKKKAPSRNVRNNIPSSTPVIEVGDDSVYDNTNVNHPNKFMPPVDHAGRSANQMQNTPLPEEEYRTGRKLLWNITDTGKHKVRAGNNRSLVRASEKNFARTRTSAQRKFMEAKDLRETIKGSSQGIRDVFRLLRSGLRAYGSE